VNYWLLDLKIPLCSGPEPIMLHDYVLKFDVYAETALASQPFTSYEMGNFISLYNRTLKDDFIGTFCDFRFDSDTPFEMTCSLQDWYSEGATDLTIFMRVDRAVWRGTFYFDNIRIEPPPPPPQ
jgi:hypothetical protein